MSSNIGESEDPLIGVVGNNVYVVWSDSTTGNSDIYFRASGNGGSSFGSIKNLSNNNSGESILPQISKTASGAVRIVWQDNTLGNNEVLFKASGNKGNTFGSIRDLSNNLGDSVNPMIISSGNNIYVVWADNTPGNYDIFFQKGLA